MKATKYQPKSQIKLDDLLRRRKSTLKDFIKDRGITTYEGLDSTCKRLGVLTPDHSAFIECVGRYVSNPAAGVVVVSPSIVVKESTGEPKEPVEDKFENLQPEISITDIKDDSEVSVVLQKAMISTEDSMTSSLGKKHQRKLQKKQDSGEGNI